MSKKSNRPTYADLDAILEDVGALNPTDTHWLLGAELALVRSNKKDKREAISKPRHSLFARALQAHPDYAPKQVEMPSIVELYKRLEAMHIKAIDLKPELPKYSQGYFGIIIGQSSWTMTKYLGRSPQPISVSIQRILFLLARATDAGLNGYLDWIEMVEEEGRTRGFDDLRALVKSGKWIHRSK